MEKQSVEFVVSEPIYVCTETATKYTLRPERGMVWLQCILFWMLGKLRCYVMDTTVTYKRYRIDTEKVLPNIQKQYENLLVHYHLKGDRLLIGSEDFAELMDMEAPSSLLSFSCPYYVQANGSSDQMIYGMKVTVIPWMRGVLVMPKEVK